MSTNHLAKLSPRDRITMRVHGWLITIYALAIGYGANWLCLQVPMLQAKIWRWPITVGALYFVGFVLSFYIYVKWWQNRAAERDRIELATTLEVEEFVKRDEAVVKRFNYLGWLDGVEALMMFFPPLGIIFLPFFIIALLYCAAILPFALTDLVANLLAELLIEFVLGLVVVNRAIASFKSKRTLGQYLYRVFWLGVFLIGVVWLIALRHYFKYKS
jgi:hypothetical protein